MKEYYENLVCACGCGGRIEKKAYHSYGGIPIFVLGHNRRTKPQVVVPHEYPLCKCGCMQRIIPQYHHQHYKIPEYIHGHNQKDKKYKINAETKDKMRKAAKGRPPSSEETKEKIRKKMLGRKHTWGWKISKAQKGKMKTEEQLRNWSKACKIKPNKQERKLNKILSEILPGIYIINVRADVMVLGGRIPDFVNVNGQKKLIEFNGDYWHGFEQTGRTKEEEEKQRIDHFAKYRYQTLIIWESELSDREDLKNKIIEFNGVSHGN
jgi:G:T-mismatch repair DNA endonuclease (very short patch repair protein)